jgi:predicted DNA-binding transcriptional regulator AlpA
MAEAVVANGGVALDDWQDRRSSQGSTTATETASAVPDTQSTASGERRTLTDIQVAARLGVSRFTVRSWRLKGVGPKFLKMGRAVRYRSEDVHEYEQRVLVNPPSR